MPEPRNRLNRLPLAALLLAWLLAACAPMRPGYEQPTVTLKSFRAVPSEGGLPAFEIGLGVVNPNREPLEVVGVSYTVRVAGYDLVKGVGKDFDVIEGYATGELKLRAEANLLEGVRLVTRMMSQPADTLDYELDAKLDLGVFRTIRLRETGEFRMDAGARGRAGGRS